MRRLVFVALVGVSGLVWADVPSVTTNAQKVVQFHVPDGQTLTYGDALDGNVVKGLEKTGGGRLVMTAAAANYSYKGHRQDIREGVLEMQVKGAIGAYNNVYISNGAQLYLNFDGDQKDYSPIPTYVKGIAGSGPDGTGAIRISSVVTKSWHSFIRNEFTLAGDTTIQCDNASYTGFSTSSALNLNGHTLTFNGKAVLWFGRNASGVGPVVNPGTGGKIVNNMTGWTTFFSAGAVFKGDATAVFEINGHTTLCLDSLDTPFPWTLRNPKQKLIYRIIGGKDRRYNVLGPIEYVGENTFSGIDGGVITFRGGIRRLDSAISGTWRIGTENIAQLYFESPSSEPSKFQISMSGQPECYYLTDTSFPRWDAEDGDYYFSGPAQYNTRKCELWLGSQNGTNYCTALGVARAIESYDTWEPYTTSRQLRLRTFGDFVADRDVSGDVGTKREDKFELVHVGAGKLDLACAIPAGSSDGGFHYRNIETNVTAFSGEHGRKASTLNVDKGTVRVDGGSLHVTTQLTVGGNNPDANATLVVGAGAVVRQSGAVEVHAVETGAKPALIRVEAGGAMTNKFISTYANASQIAAGTVFKSAVNQYGDVTAMNGGYIANWSGLGFWGLGGGTLNASSSNCLLGMAGTRGMFQMDGGTLQFDTANLSGTTGGRSDILVRGGRIVSSGGRTLYLASTSDCSGDKPGDFASFTMMGAEAVVENVDISLNSRTNGYPTIVNLNAGRLVAKGLGTTRSVEKNPNYFNFNGGTLAMSADNTSRANFWQSDFSPTAITIYEKGGTIEVNRPLDAEGTFGSDRVGLVGPLNYSSYQLSAEPKSVLRPLSGRGVKSVKIPDDMPRSGYVGIMPVKILGGDGFGATAALDFDMKTGTIAEELLVTCSGNDYTNAPTVVAYGPDYVTEYVCTVELTEDNRVAGPLVKTGPGTLTLKVSDHNSYIGPYVVSNGTLFANYAAMIPQGMHVRLAGGTFNWDWRSITLGTLGGWGTVFGNLSTATYHANVTDAFVVDAADLVAGRFLKVRNEGDGNCLNHTVAFGADCVVKVENSELLDRNASYLLFRQYAKINRKPQLDPELTEKYRLSLRNGGKELWIKGKLGLGIIVR